MLPFEHRCTIRVRYAESDQMGVVWHGDYIQYFEEARTEALRACGASYRALEESGTMMPVVELGIQYHKPARYDDLLTVVTRVFEPPRSRMRFDYEIFDEGGVLLVTGFTVLAFVSVATRHPCRPPALVKQIFA